MAAGVSSGPAPWWQQAPNQGKVANLQASAPSGYEYDPVQMQYTRTPTSAGDRLGQALNGLTGTFNGFGGGSAMGVDGSASGSGTSGSPVPNVSYPSTGGAASPASTVAPVQYDSASLDAADSAAFGKAKDQASQTARAALTGLSGELSARGMGGAGYEAGQIGGTLSREANTIGDASRSEAQNRADMMMHAADENYQGAVTQRNQDVNASTSANNAKFSGDIAQRGQSLQANEAGTNADIARQSLAQQKQLALANLYQNSLRSITGSLSSSFPLSY